MRCPNCQGKGYIESPESAARCTECMGSGEVERASEPTIYELMGRVREHPDFAFGVVFTREDFPEGVPEDFAAKHIEEYLTQIGNEHIADQT